MTIINIEILDTHLAGYQLRVCCYYLHKKIGSILTGTDGHRGQGGVVSPNWCALYLLLTVNTLGRIFVLHLIIIKSVPLSLFNEQI